MTAQSDIGLIGLAVMGQNLILNMNDHGYTVTAYNRTTAKTDAFLAGPANETNIVGARTLQEFVNSLKRPRRIMLMVRAGDAVDKTIESLLPLIEPGDVIIDGGNSNFVDTQRRALTLAEKDILFVGTGVSGGEEGARHGPSIMPGGHAEAWPLVKDLLQSIAAKTDDGTPCCDWVGRSGSGHFVKMVHNGIEYGDMQLICETYDFMKTALNMDNAAMQQVFTDWNQRSLRSYLIEITADILGYQEDGQYVLDHILDAAGQKGTGKWTAINALDLGIPLTLIGEAVFARCLSALKSEREKASARLDAISASHDELAPSDWIPLLEQALLASKITSYAQGFMLMRAASEEHDWALNYGNVAMMWREGCIIRSVFLDDIKAAYDKAPELPNLLLDDYFATTMLECQQAWRRVVAKAIEYGVPMPAMSAALAYFDGYRSANLPANLLQAQRDYFGAHTYERKDRPRGEFFHTEWTGASGGVSSNAYNV